MMYYDELNQQGEEQTPLVDKQDPEKPQQPKVSKIYPTTCDSCMKSTKFFCSKCNAILYSKVTIETSKETWYPLEIYFNIQRFAVVVMCFFPYGGFCLIPLMIDYMKDYIHRCPSCNKIVGKREYTIAKPLKILMIALILLIIALLLIFIILSVFYGNQMWEEFKKAQKFKKEMENGEGE